MNIIDKNAPVAIDKCKEYNYSQIFDLIKKQVETLLNGNNIFENKNVVIKPNLLMKASPDKAVTTHPTVMEAVINTIKMYNPLSITIAESPGGPYTSATLGIIYNSTGMINVAKKCGVSLNYDTSSEQISNPDGAVCKVFDIITPIKNADVIVNVCKLKTHSLTTMSASVKNLFGTIPGIEKFEMHTRYKDLPVFEKMLSDLCLMHLRIKPMLCVVDAVNGMEGNGPSGGDTRNFGLLLSSFNPFNLDTVASALLGVEGQIGYLEAVNNLDVRKTSAADIEIIGEELNDVIIKDVKLPESRSLPILKKLPTIFGGRLNRFFEPRPQIITSKCIGCGECARSCPAKTIELITDKTGKKKAKIIDTNCIKCYCCQELCPINSVKIKKNPIFLLIK